MLHKRKITTVLAIPLLAGVMGTRALAAGPVTMQYESSPSLSVESTSASSSDFAATFTYTSGANNGQTITMISSGDLIGLYAFDVTTTVAGGPPLTPNPSTQPFWATCLSPAGYLNGNTHTYDLTAFSSAGNGINPNGVWSTAGANNDAGIQNASFLYSQVAHGILSGGVAGQSGTAAQQGAALALAMYQVLYNSTGYGTYDSAAGGSAGVFKLTGGLTGSVATDYTDDLALLSKGFNPDYTGYVLVPNPNDSQNGSGQDMILLGNPGQNYSVPEPTTVMAGALLLLPFGASTLRILRRNRGTVA